MRIRAVLLAVFLASLLIPRATRSQAGAPPTPARSDSSAAAARSSVLGIVFDSLTNAPLAGAIVLLSETFHSARADAAGRYRLDDVAEGTYTVSAASEVLDSLWIQPPGLKVEVRRGHVAVADLSTPSVATLIRFFCPPGYVNDSTGLILGLVSDAETDVPIGGAEVVFRWAEWEIDKAGLHHIPKEARVVTDANGWYRVCGLPAELDLASQSTAGKSSSGETETRVERNSFAIRYFSIGKSDSATTAVADKMRGNARLTGIITRKAGKPLTGAHVEVIGTGVQGVTDDGGAFALSGLPSGTQSVEVRAIGYAPRRASVELKSRHPAHLALVLEDLATVLERVLVTQPALRRDRMGFDFRRRRGMGHFISRDQIEKRGAFQFVDLMRTIPSLRVVPSGFSDYRVMSSRGASLGTGSGGCEPAYYVDGMPLMGESSVDVNRMINPGDVEAIEVYAGAATVPPEFNVGTCGVIVIWTRIPEPRPKKVKKPKETG